MAHIVRPGKTGGTHRYTEEVAVGQDLIRETEVDGDFDTVYGEFNGGIDDTNIRDGASIDYSKLDLLHRITPDDLVPGFVLPPASLPPNTVPGGTIVDRTITKDKLVPGASLWCVGQAVHTGNVALDGSTDYLTVALTPPNVPRWGFVKVSGNIQGSLIVQGAVDYTVNIEVKLDGTPFWAWAQTFRGSEFSIGSPPVTYPIQVTCGFALPFSSYIFMSTGVGHTVSARVFLGTTPTFAITNAGFLLIEEPS